jgi:hypothetical protein
MFVRYALELWYKKHNLHCTIWHLKLFDIAAFNVIMAQKRDPDEEKSEFELMAYLVLYYIKTAYVKVLRRRSKKSEVLYLDPFCQSRSQILPDC